MSDLLRKIKSAQVHAGELAVVEEMHEKGLCGKVGCPFCEEAKETEMVTRAYDLIFPYVPEAMPLDQKVSELIKMLDASRVDSAEAMKNQERLDFMEKHLCRAGDIVSRTGQVTGIIKCWQVVTQLDESLRLTIDRLRAAFAASDEQKG